MYPTKHGEFIEKKTYIKYYTKIFMSFVIFYDQQTTRVRSLSLWLWLFKTLLQKFKLKKVNVSLVQNRKRKKIDFTICKVLFLVKKFIQLLKFCIKALSSLFEVLEVF